jgi:hypothetical protein
VRHTSIVVSAAGRRGAAGTVVAAASGIAGCGTRRSARMSALLRGIRPASGPFAPRRDLAGNGSVPQGTAHVAGNGYAPRALKVQAGDRTPRLLTIGLVDAPSGGGYDGGESGD